MKLINGQKRADFLKAENSKTSQVTADEIKEFPQSYMIAAFSDGVIKGIEFAETELQEIAIEFSNWKELNVEKHSNASIGFYYKINGGSEQYFYNNQLFQEFLKQRKA